MPRLTSFRTALAAAVVVAAAVPSVASADGSVSANWAGYVAHRAGVRFRSVSATWTEPAPACGPYPSYSSAWVGLGGFNAKSSALEQVGTEADCGLSGARRSFAWYELVPAPSSMIRMTVDPGDTLRARVIVVGRRVTVKLVDITRRESFAKTVRTPVVDVSSADWIVESPSACFSNNYCRTLPLANFGTIDFAGASAQSRRGRTGAVASHLWGETSITLAPSPRSYIAFGAAGSATPSPLTNGGSAFDVAYTPAPAQGGQAPASTGLVTSSGAVTGAGAFAASGALTTTPQPGGRRR